MRICVSGTICQGKTTLVNDFLKEWDSYELCDMSYRRKLRENNMPHSSNGTEESQRVIRDAMIDDICQYNRDHNVIFDRGLLDNLTYTLYLHEKGRVSDQFVKENVSIIREAMSFYDIILFVPMMENYDIPLEKDEDGIREVNSIFRDESDVIMKEIVNTYRYGQNRTFFPNNECPAVIDVVGKRQERVETIKLYVTDDGGCYGESDNLIASAMDGGPSGLVDKDGKPLLDLDAENDNYTHIPTGVAKNIALTNPNPKLK